ncbi:MAG: aminoglycoside phosphotransferase family protein [Nocardioides sp.]
MSDRHAVGVRATWPEMPQPIRLWLANLLGSRFVAVEEQRGGMSPGCATRIACADGTRVFVKVVGRPLNPDTPNLFRREVTALDLIGSHPLWAGLLAVWDDDDWVAVVLEDVQGRHPDLHDDVDLAWLLRATDELTEVLAERVPDPPPPRPRDGGLADLHDKWRVQWPESLERLAAVRPAAVPEWLLERVDDVRDHLALLADQTERRLVHADIRSDNLLVRPSGQLVFLDWGMATVGPGWVDPLLARLERVEDPWFDASVQACPALADAGDDVVTAFLLGIGCHVAWLSTTPVDASLPTLSAFRVAESRRFLAGAARRLGVRTG